MGPSVDAGLGMIVSDWAARFAFAAMHMEFDIWLDLLLISWEAH